MSRQSPRRPRALRTAARTDAANQHAAAGLSTAATPAEAAAGANSNRKSTQPRSALTAAAAESAAQSADSSERFPQLTHHAVWSFAAKAPISQQLLPSLRPSPAADHLSGEEDEVAPEQLASQPCTLDPSADQNAGATAAAADTEPTELRSWHDEIPEEAFDQLTVEAEARALLNQPTAAIDDSPTEYEDTFDAEDEKQQQHSSCRDKPTSIRSSAARSPSKPKQKLQPHPSSTATAAASTPRTPRTPLSARQSAASSPSKAKAATSAAAGSSSPRTGRAIQPLTSIAAADSAAVTVSADPFPGRAEDGALSTPALPVLTIKPPSNAGSASSFSVISALQSTLTAAQHATQTSQNALSAKNLRIRSLQRDNEALGVELDQCKQQLQLERGKRQLQRNSSVSSIASGGGAGSLGFTPHVQLQHRKHHRQTKRSRSLEEDLAASRMTVNKLSVALETARRRLRIKLGRDAPPALLRALRQARSEASELKLQLTSSLASQCSFEHLMDLQHTVDEQSALIDQLHSQLREAGARIDEDEEVEVQMLPGTTDPLADEEDARDDQRATTRPVPCVPEQKAAWRAQQAATADSRSPPQSDSPSSPAAPSPPVAVASAAAAPANATDAPVSPALAATTAALRSDLAIQRALVSQYASRQLVHDRLSKQQYSQLVSLTREYHNRGEIIHQLNARVKELMEDREWQAQERQHGVEPVAVSGSGGPMTPMTPQSQSNASVESPISQTTKAAIMPPPIVPLSSPALSSPLHSHFRHIEGAALVPVSPVQLKSPQSLYILPTQGSMHTSSSATHASPSQPHLHPPLQPQPSSPPPPRAAVPILQLPTIAQTITQQVTSAPTSSATVGSAIASAPLSTQRGPPSVSAPLAPSSNSPHSPIPAFSVTPALAALTPILIQQRQLQVHQQPQHGYGQRAWSQVASPLSSPLPGTRSRQHMSAALSAYSGSQSHR